MNSIAHCPECGVAWINNQTCTAYFHTLGFWELDHQLLDKHHLMVLAYHLQHPSLYSPTALASAQQQLVDFVEQGVSVQTMRQRLKTVVDSGVRTFKIKGDSQNHGAYDHPIQWTMTIQDVVSAGIEHYYASVDKWALSVLQSLRISNNFKPRDYSEA